MYLRAEKWQRLEARLAAAEYLTVNLYAQALLRRANPPEAFRAVNDKLRLMLEDQTLPGNSQSWRDGVSLELRCAMEHALLLMEEIVERTVKERAEEAANMAKELSFEI